MTKGPSYTPLPPQTTIGDGRYTLNKLLAVGGMGAVYRGVRKSRWGFALPVAIKELLPHLSHKAPILELFFSEAKLHEKLHHNNIVRVVDLFETDGRYYIVFEWVEGMDLRDALKKMIALERPFPVEVALFLFREVLFALIYAHSLKIPEHNIDGIVHRDISPSNILLSYVGEVKLTDFGISKAGERLAHFKRVPGKRGYMPPEQVAGELGDPKTDIFSLLVCLFESLTLLNPVGYRTTKGTLPQLRHIRQDVPSDLEKLILRGLSPEPHLRPTSLELMASLQELVAKYAIILSPLKLKAFLSTL